MKWTLEQIAAATSGRAIGTATVESFSTDSREIGPGSLFVALRGSRWDGHDFAAAAVEAGAVGCMVERGRLPGGISGVEVEDTVAALASLAAAARDRITVPVVAVTGSSGKTTTKDMTAAALGTGAHAAPRSFNNEIGLPLTVLATPESAAAVVLEVGSRGLGHITALGPSIRPNVAVITNIGPAHLETFGDLATVAAAKWELVEALEEGGTAVLPEDLDDPGPAPGRVVRFGEGHGADVRVDGVAVDDAGRVSCTISHGGASASVTLPLPGRHQARNAAAAVAVAVVLGRPLAAAVSGVASTVPSPWRMELADVPVPGGTIRVLNDAYNANPQSMAAALETAAAMAGRKIAVLGKMHELGEEERRYHLEAGALAASLGFDAVVVVGEDPGIAEGAGAIAVSCGDAVAALDVLGDLLRAGDVVIVKASRAAGLEQVATALVEGRAA